MAERASTARGSSPRTWGTQHSSAHYRCPWRFIPTHVGNTTQSGLRRLRRPVHPHARGEHGEGSRRPGVPERFIPTHVGNTSGRGGMMCPVAVHPHARGEHPQDDMRSPVGPGSSPRTWGTLRAWCGRIGSTPVHPHARGEHVGELSTPPRPPVHPHARGEHVNLPPSSETAYGSSPRTWGTLRAGCRVREAVRFIPTHVGNTPNDTESDLGQIGSSPRTWGTRRSSHLNSARESVHPHARGEHVQPSARTIPKSVHPHARGEHARTCASMVVPFGSSPRTWGTRPDRPNGSVTRRFIPTHVGNTNSDSPSVVLAAVHPHARGEHDHGSKLIPGALGSSPRTWGTRSEAADVAQRDRFIPTHVGNTELRQPVVGRQRFIPTHVGNTRLSR